MIFAGETWIFCQVWIWQNKPGKNFWYYTIYSARKRLEPVFFEVNEAEGSQEAKQVWIWVWHVFQNMYYFLKLRNLNWCMSIMLIFLKKWVNIKIALFDVDDLKLGYFFFSSYRYVIYMYALRITNSQVFVLQFY